MADSKEVPEVGAIRKCLLCALDKPWGLFDTTTGATVCKECKSLPVKLEAEIRRGDQWNASYTDSQAKLDEQETRVMAVVRDVRSRWGLTQSPEDEMEGVGWCGGCEEYEADCDCDYGHMRKLATRLAAAVEVVG